jgi:transposase
MKSRRKQPRESRPSGRESVGFRRRREKRRKIESFLAGKPLVAGIDLGSKTHAVWLTGRDLDPKEHFRIDHSLEGIAKLLQRTERVRVAESFDRPIVFMETTGHYWKNVAAALERNGVVYRTISPLAVDRKREIEHLTYAKGDFRDAELIARLGVEGHWLQRVLEAKPIWIELAALAREHELLLGLEVRERLRRRSLLELALPEFLDVFKDPCMKTASALLRRLSAPAVSTIEELVERAASLKAERRLQSRKVKALIALLKSGPTYGVSRMLRVSFLRVRVSLDRFDLVSEQRERIREQLLELYRTTPYACRLDTIPGVDPASNAILLGFTGDPAAYDRATCLVKFAGIEPRENHSDSGEGSHAISRRGSPQVRHVLFRILTGFLNGNDEFSAYMSRLTSRSTNPLAHHQAIVAAANKYLRVLHHLWTHDEAYDPAKVIASASEESTTPTT